MTRYLAPDAVRDRLTAGAEIAFLDVREAGQYGAGHPLLAAPLPYSRLELEAETLVPRRSAPVVLLDAGDGVAEAAARRLTGLGYETVWIVDGGAPAWAAAGLALFEGVNVPSKAFGEHVEHAYATPSICATELKERLDAGAKVAIFDARPPDEFHRMSIPGAVDCPGAELVPRVAGAVSDPDALVVVNCAGRTRSIIGAQSLINAGLANPVRALRDGTQGWVLAGFELARGTAPRPPDLTPRGRAFARDAARRIAARFGLSVVPRERLEDWRHDPERTCYLLDVRTREEFLAGHLPGAVHAPGGQLVQATDRWLGTRGARVVLCDDDGARAVITAHWLLQMGWEVHVLAPPSDGSETGPAASAHRGAPPDKVGLIAPGELAARLADRALDAIDVGGSMDFRAGHVPGARWVPRPRLTGDLMSRRPARPVVLISEDDTLARLAALDARECLDTPVAVLAGGRAAWRAAGLPLESSPETPCDAACIDHLFWAHDRHSGNRASMRLYLDWERGLPARLAADGTLRFAAPPPNDAPSRDARRGADPGTDS